tara:strand:+ start:841 stop:1062 length:222 start_codon:yes stop_codon:yes gene_type:complete
MLDFYRVDAIIILIIITVMFILYNSLDYISDDIKKIDKIYKIFFSFLIGFLVSVAYSFLTLEKDVLLTDNYWD